MAIAHTSMRDWTFFYKIPNIDTLSMFATDRASLQHYAVRITVPSPCALSHDLCSQISLRSHSRFCGHVSCSRGFPLHPYPHNLLDSQTIPKQQSFTLSPAESSILALISAPTPLTLPLWKYEGSSRGASVHIYKRFYPCINAIKLSGLFCWSSRNSNKVVITRHVKYTSNFTSSFRHYKNIFRQICLTITTCGRRLHGRELKAVYSRGSQV
jgi:hypothetical protein